MMRQASGPSSSDLKNRLRQSFRNADKPLRVEIAYCLQEIDPIDKNIWDIALHGVVNERGWFTFDN